MQKLLLRGLKVSIFVYSEFSAQVTRLFASFSIRNKHLIIKYLSHPLKYCVTVHMTHSVKQSWPTGRCDNHRRCPSKQHLAMFSRKVVRKPV